MFLKVNKVWRFKAQASLSDGMAAQFEGALGTHGPMKGEDSEGDGTRLSRLM